MNELNLKELQDLPKEVLQIAIDRERSIQSLYNFFLLCMDNIYTHIEFENNWHYKVLCDLIQSRVEKMLRHEKDKHLLINLPIRCGKSILIGEIFPVWLWIISDKLMIQSICCTQRLATKSSRMSKLIITSEWFQKRFPEIKLSEDNKSKSDYSTKSNGTRISYGIDSSQIGTSADVQIIDDPNDPSEKNSDTAIRNVRDTFQEVIVGRMNNEWSLRIILQQRTSAKDLCGYLLENNANDYRHICIPAELTKDVSPEFIKYYQDGLFFLKRYSKRRLDQYKRDMTAHAYASQLLQAPSALEGSIIKKVWFKIIKNHEFNKLSQYKTMLFLDTAYTSDEGNDPTAFFVCTLINKRIYVLYVDRLWLEFHDLILKINDLIKDYNIKEIYIEKKASGISVKSELQRQIQHVMIMGIDTGTKSKVERAKLTQTYLNNGNVILVEGLWNNLFLEETASFPYSTHDDITDCLVYSVIVLLISRYSAKSILEAGLNIIKDGKTWEEKNSYLNNKSDNYYYD